MASRVRKRRSIGFTSSPAALPGTLGLVGKTVIEQLARIPVEVEIASEYRYRESDLHREHAGHRDQPVRRDSRHAGGTA